MKNFFYEPLIEKHKGLINEDNCVVCEIFELLIGFCTFALLGISMLRKEYGSMTEAYIAFFLFSFGMFFITRFYVRKHLEYTTAVVLIVLTEGYLYSILSGIVFNLDAPSITVYTLMVAACSAYTLPFRFIVVYNTLVAVIYCSIALMVKPAYGVQDTINYVLFLAMSFTLTRIIHKSRMAYLRSVDDALEQKNVAEENERLERELRISTMNLYDEGKQKEKLNQALEIAEQANQAKTDFLSRVSHDMRTPLNGILGLTSLLRENVENEKAKQDLQQLEMSGQYLLNLINDTLDVSKIESGKLELHPIVCDGRAVFGNILALAKPNLQAKNIQFHVHTENLPFTTLYMDVGRVEQVVMNILGNAIKFTPEGGTIDFTMINLSMEKGKIVDQIIISDSGIGMSKEFLPHLFEPFSQEDNGRTSSYQGTGLGMTITKQIVELMGGDIQVESEVGKGTTFTFTLPMIMATNEQVEQWKQIKMVETKDVTLQGKRVLMCEDHPLNAKIAKRLLGNKGMLIEHAENGSIGVEMFEKSPLHYYDLVLMDIRMPVMDGIEAARTIRALAREDAQTVPIAAMTANAFDEDVRQVKAAGMDAHISKPIEIEKFYDTLENLMNLDRVMNQKVILIVDDIEVNRAALHAILCEDYTLLDAENGQKAWEIMQTHNGIDAVITDIQMPEMDGVELIRRIRSNDKYRHIVIIANTQFGDRDQEDELLKLGANEFVYKPNSAKIVEMRIRNALQSL